MSRILNIYCKTAIHFLHTKRNVKGPFNITTSKNEHLFTNYVQTLNLTDGLIVMKVNIGHCELGIFYLVLCSLNRNLIKTQTKTKTIVQQMSC